MKLNPDPVRGRAQNPSPKEANLLFMVGYMHPNTLANLEINPTDLLNPNPILPLPGIELIPVLPYPVWHAIIGSVAGLARSPPPGALHLAVGARCGSYHLFQLHDQSRRSSWRALQRSPFAAQRAALATGTTTGRGGSMKRNTAPSSLLGPRPRCKASRFGLGTLSANPKPIAVPTASTSS